MFFCHENVGTVSQGQENICTVLCRQENHGPVFIIRKPAGTFYSGINHRGYDPRRKCTSTYPDNGLPIPENRLQFKKFNPIGFPVLDEEPSCP
jgi:hypothetical protein